MKTTILGVLTIVSVICASGIQFLKTSTFDFAVTFAGVTAGIGLIKAADSAPVVK